MVPPKIFWGRGQSCATQKCLCLRFYMFPRSQSIFCPSIVLQKSLIVLLYSSRHGVCFRNFGLEEDLGRGECMMDYTTWTVAHHLWWQQLCHPPHVRNFFYFIDG